MTPEEFRAIRTRAGLSLDALARVLRIADKASVHRWEKGTRAISGPVTILMELLDSGDLPSHYLDHRDKPRPSSRKFTEPEMRVIVYAQDLSGRNDDGYYSKPDISSALDIFFDAGKMDAFIDDEGENPLSRGDAEEIFRSFKKLTFYNSDGEKIIISHDPSA